MSEAIGNESKKTRVAVVGYGGMGRWHCGKIKKLPEILELAGIYDIADAAKERAHEKGYYVYETLEELLNDKSVTLVTVAIPNHLHKDMCITLMAAGKNVICEKPVCLNHEELQAMFDASEKYGVLFTVHQNRRWDEDFLVAKKLYDENALGRVFRIESRVHGSRGIPGDWRNQKACGGGMVYDWGVHLLDQMMQITKGKKIKSVYAQLSFVTNEDCDDGYTVMLTFEDDFTAVVQSSTSNFIALPRWYVLGENGTCEIERFNMDGKIVMVSDWENRDAVPVQTAAGLTKTMAPRTSDTIQEYPLPRIESDVRDFYRNVVKVLAGEAEPLIKHEELMRVMLLMEAVFESAHEQKVITDFEDRCKAVIG